MPMRSIPSIVKARTLVFGVLLCSGHLLFPQYKAAPLQSKGQGPQDMEIGVSSHHLHLPAHPFTGSHAPGNQTVRLAGGPYIEIRGGLSFFNDTKLQVDRLEQVFGKGARSTFDTKPGRLLEIAAGHSLGPWFRWEIIGGHLRSALEDYRFWAGGRIVEPLVDGTIGGWYGLGNVYYDLRPAQIGMEMDQMAFVLGGGLGFMDMALDAQLDGAHVIEDSDTVLAYQLTAGISLRMDRTLALSAIYRYLATEPPGFNSLDPRLGEARVVFGNHNILLGLRFTL